MYVDEELTFDVIYNAFKYPIPYLVQLLLPRYNGHIPKLNNLLEDGIVALATDMNLDYIFVRPIGNQGSILKKYFGYKETEEELTYPCQTISVGFDTWLYKEVNRCSDV